MFIIILCLLKMQLQVHGGYAVHNLKTALLFCICVLETPTIRQMIQKPSLVKQTCLFAFQRFTPITSGDLGWDVLIFLAFYLSNRRTIIHYKKKLKISVRSIDVDFPARFLFYPNPIFNVLR